ncbi:transketolase C-terminal domain-containing protein [Paenibacillus validus]|uniref:Transketolase n=1 Tax=Paenibacillus validus TaxID=44253 RepID=A0A7X2Z856_9BACL|nr:MULTISPECIES: transketolase C-terminal domain-containing protein [Paenibacillus]MED4599293.1 transketolase C-terminal domain-containing protein [Paenibacillus validus]MED4606395.1 transketolase C-terminal domain-containing protein [Paenibacillus validus]MUG70083.1 transketolase [Paenibacillus validus]
MAVEISLNFDQILSSAREVYGSELMKMADEGLEFAFLCSDNVAPSSTVGKFMSKYPDRCFNVGIAEANQVGISAGLALSGKIVFSQVFGPFLPLRAADQIHADIAYNDVPVRLIGTHAGVTSGGGPTHNAIADLSFYRAVPNLTIICPADANQCARVVRESMSYPGPMIIRIARGAEPDVYLNNDYEFQIGKSITVQEGKDLTLIGTGSSVYWSLMAAKELEQSGIKARVIDMHTIKPFDTDAVLRAALETGCVVTVEDQSINGGLGGAVAEIIAEAGVACKFKRIGLPDQFAVLGEPNEVYKYYGMDPQGIAQTVKSLL